MSFAFKIVKVNFSFYFQTIFLLGQFKGSFRWCKQFTTLSLSQKPNKNHHLLSPTKILNRNPKQKLYVQCISFLVVGVLFWNVLGKNQHSVKYYSFVWELNLETKHDLNCELDKFCFYIVNKQMSHYRHCCNFF